MQVLQGSAGRDSSRQATQERALIQALLDCLHYCKGRRLPLHIRVCREDDLADPARADALYEASDRELGHLGPLRRIQRPHQDVVHTVEGT